MEDPPVVEIEGKKFAGNLMYDWEPTTGINYLKSVQDYMKQKLVHKGTVLKHTFA